MSLFYHNDLPFLIRRHREDHNRRIITGEKPWPNVYESPHPFYAIQHYFRYTTGVLEKMRQYEAYRNIWDTMRVLVVGRKWMCQYVRSLDNIASTYSIHSYHAIRLKSRGLDPDPIVPLKPSLVRRFLAVYEECRS